MSVSFTERLAGFARLFFGETDVIHSPEEEIQGEEAEGEELLAQVEQARQEWLAARSLFDSAVDSALIDYAILSLEAAERKYVYLLNQAKRRGVRCRAYWAIPPHRR